MSSIVFALTAIIRALLPYGAAFADRILPALAALEYIAEHRVCSDALLAEVRVLRLRAQVAVRDFAGAFRITPLLSLRSRVMRTLRPCVPQVRWKPWASCSSGRRGP